MYLLIGILIGFVAAIPLGPVNAFVISQMMKRGSFLGLLAGATAATLDTLYCLIALLGFSLVTDNIDRYETPLKIAAGVVLVILGIRLFIQSHKPIQRKSEKTTIAFSPRPFLGVFLLYVSNPSIYAFWIWAAGWATSHGWVLSSKAGPYLFAVSCGLGGFLWYVILTVYVSKYHHQFSQKTFKRIFLLMALMLFGFAAYTFLSLFVKI